MWERLDDWTTVHPRYVRRGSALLLISWLFVFTPLTFTVWAQSVLWVNVQSALAIVFTCVTILSAERPSEVVE